MGDMRRTATYLGLNYETGRMSQWKGGAGDIVINANQPKSNLLRVLFERQSRISDSVTYDITAWSVPYVYGLQAYGLNNYVTGVEGAGGVGCEARRGARAGYDVCVCGAVGWSEQCRVPGSLLRKGVKVRFAERPFQSGGVAMTGERC